LREDREILYKREGRPDLTFEEEEIDLYELFLILKRHIKLIAFTVILATLLSVAYSLLATPVYKSTFIVRLPSYNGDKYIFSVQEAKKNVDNLGIFLGQERYDELSEMLNISKSDISLINRIEASLKRGQSHFLEISLFVYDPSIIDRLKVAIVDYLNNNPFVQEKIKMERFKLLTLKKEVEAKIKNMESMRRVIEQNLKSGNVRDYGFNPLEMEKVIMELKMRLEDIKMRLLTLKGFEVAVEPVIPTKPHSPKKLLIISVAFISSLFFGIFLAFFIEWYRNARNKHIAEIPK